MFFLCLQYSTAASAQLEPKGNWGRDGKRPTQRQEKEPMSHKLQVLCLEYAFPRREEIKPATKPCNMNAGITRTPEQDFQTKTSQWIQGLKFVISCSFLPCDWTTPSSPNDVQVLCKALPAAEALQVPPLGGFSSAFP